MKFLLLFYLVVLKFIRTFVVEIYTYNYKYYKIQRYDNNNNYIL